jgi:hypothetical protein
MSEPLAATARIELTYTILNFQHRLRHYCAYNDVLGQHQLVDRDGITTILWTVAAQYWWDKLRPLLENATWFTPPQAQLQHRDGAIWNPIDFATLTGTESSGQLTYQASQATLVLRDSAFKKIRVLALEHTGGYAFHSQSGQGPNQAFTEWTNAYSGADTSANAMYRWVKSRGDRFILGTGNVAGLTFDLNDKLKRARGLA